MDTYSMLTLLASGLISLRVRLNLITRYLIGFVIQQLPVMRMERSYEILHLLNMPSSEWSLAITLPGLRFYSILLFHPWSSDLHRSCEWLRAVARTPSR